MGLLTSEVISVVGLVGVSTYLIVAGGRQQLVQQAKSELAVTEIQYNIKINQMGFGFRGQSDNTAIVEATQLHANSIPLSSDLSQQVRTILQNEIQARDIEYATLVGRDLKIIVNANTDRSGDTFNPNNLVRRVLAQGIQIKTSEYVPATELTREGAPTKPTDPYVLIRYTVTPVQDPDTAAVIGALISGDVVNGKQAIAQDTVEALSGGYSALYLQTPSEDIVPIISFASAGEQSPNQVSTTRQNPVGVEETLLQAAIDASGETVTGRQQLGDKTYTMAAQAILNHDGDPVAVMVRGTSESALNALLGNNLLTQGVITLIAIAADIGLAVLLSLVLIRPIKRLQATARQYANGDLQQRAKIFAQDEVGQLTETFNQMASRLEQKNEMLEQQTLAQAALNTQLKAEVEERHRVDLELRKSEVQLRQKARMLEKTLNELKLAQVHMIQTEKMSGLGQLVAGVAHEINNPVSFIKGNLSHACDYIEGLLGLIKLYQHHFPNPPPEIQEEVEDLELDFLSEDLPKLLDSMRVGTRRIQEIVSSLRTFSRMDEAEFKAVDIHAGIDSTLLILQHRLKDQPEYPAIQVIKKYEELPLVECYASQLNQVFMNILANAIDALEEISLRRTFQINEDNPSQISISTTVLPSGWVEIAISDNGPGIPKSIQSSIFNPFFTTKPAGKGTGLGMSISHQIITERHGGHLKCVSVVGKGTQFIIQIPSQRRVQASALARGTGIEAQGKLPKPTGDL
ncbi:MAG: ATP-binding protein [Leptolyngbyaceae cyanobacterium]